jgi:hypothetical protein
VPHVFSLEGHQSLGADSSDSTAVAWLRQQNILVSGALILGASMLTSLAVGWLAVGGLRLTGKSR